MKGVVGLSVNVMSLRTRMAVLREKTRGRKGLKKFLGVSLIELIAVAIILGVFALIVVPNVVNALGISKGAAFSSTLSEVQSGSDQFYAVNNQYPTYVQPVASTSAAAINFAATDVADANTFLPNYIRTEPTSSPANLGLNTANGASVYYGVVASGQVFATQTAPTSNAWSTGTTSVFTVQHHTNGVQLSTIW